MKKYYLFQILTFFYCINLASQDSLKLESLLSIDLNGQHNLSAFVNNFDCFHCGGIKVRDNPLFHFAMYLGINNKLVINDNYSIESAMFIEERNHSGGNNTLSNLIFFPKILLEAKDTFSLLNKNFGVKLKGGDYWNEDVSDIIQLYNIDYNCLEIDFSYNNWTLSLMTIGDLSLNVGLDLTQVYRTSLGYQKGKIKNVFHASLNELSTTGFSIHTMSNDWNLSNYVRYDISEESSIESQLAIRINRDYNGSIAAAIRGVFNSDRIVLNYGIRYYQAAFNKGFNGRKPRYATSTEFVGEQLYPLRNYYRSFSQWAVYTHNQDQTLLGLELGLKWDVPIYKKFYFFSDIDINGLYDLTNETLRVYPFYNVGLNCKFLNQFHARLSLTNKQMNLNTFYQTFKASKVPFPSLGVRLKISDIQLTKLHINRSVNSF